MKTKPDKPDYELLLRTQLSALENVMEAEWKFHPTRKWRFDFAWPLSRVAAEIDGGIWIHGRHTRGSGQLKDNEKFNEAAVLGWRILRFTPQQVSDGTAAGTIRRVVS